MYGDITQVRVMLGRPWQSTDEEGQATALLERAGRLIDELVPAAASRAETDEGFAAAAADVAVDAVLRVVRDPDGLLREGVDDAQWQRDRDTVGGRLRLLDAEVTRLRSWRAASATAGVPGVVFVGISG